jgi:diguanylate cyclase (GGDEF)-like protein/PAS domain S-box-containing protein
MEPDFMEKKKPRSTEALRNSEQRYRELYDSMQRQAQEMALLDRVRTAVAGELDLKGVIRTVVEGIAETFGYPLVSLYMRQGDRMILEHQVGYADVIQEIPITKGVLGKTVLTGQAILLDDVHIDPDFLEAIPGIESEVCVPLFDRDQVVGALNVESRPGMKLTEADLWLMTALSENISIAISHARLYTEIRESEERYRSLFQNASMGIFHSLPEGKFLQVNPTLAKMFGYASPEEMVASITDINTQIYVDSKKRPELLDATLKQKGWIYAENRYRRKDGSIITANLAVRKVLDADGKLAYLEGFVEDITERRRIEEAEHEQRVLAESLRDTAAALNSALELDQVLDNILTHVGRVVPHDAAYIMLIDDNGEGYVVREHGFSGRAGGEKIQALHPFVTNVPHLREIVETTQPVIVPDTEAVPDWSQTSCAVWARSYAGIPIEYMGVVVGFINLFSATEGFFTSAHTERLQTFSNQIATVFANSRLVEELQKANARLQEQLSENQALQIELSEQAIRDPLTGVFNRRYLQVTLDREIARVNRASQPVGIMIMDIDHFKLINDTYGHKAGDLILQALGDLLKSNIRKEDIACRYGGEEFVVVMPGASLQTARERADIIRYQFEALRVSYENRNIHATVSLGVAAYPQHGTTGEDVLIRADRALYHAKQEGRNRVVIYQDTFRMPFIQQDP